MNIRNLPAMLVVTTLLFAPAAHANKGMSKDEMQSHIQTLQQAASELRATNPSLADKLTDMANKKQQKMNEKHD